MKTYLNGRRQLFPYLIAGALTTAVNYAAYYLITRGLGAPILPATGLAWALSVLFAYGVNRRWVFASKTRGLKVLCEAGAFLSARLLSAFLDLALMAALTLWAGVGDMLSKLLVNILVIILNYIISKRIIFKGADGE